MVKEGFAMNSRRFPEILFVLAALLLCLSFVTCAENSNSENLSSEDASTTDSGAPDADELVRLGIPGAESTDEACSNGQDDDNTGYTDCADFWCSDSPWVQVCGTLENTDELCADGIDNEERATGKSYFDGLTDCADPDCAKNPAVTVCPVLTWELGDDCLDSTDNDGDGLTDCADPDCLHAASPCPLNGVKRVLFDNAHRQRAGNGDWVVDVSGRHPWPSVPVHETDWAGSLSSFGKALFDTGRFAIEILPVHGAFSFGTQAEQDLKNYSVLILPEPSVNLTSSEAKAVVDFVLAGGGLLFITDHSGSDRDNNGWDSVQVFNDMLAWTVEGGDITAHPFGFSVASIDYAESGRIEQKNGGVAQVIDANAAEHPIITCGGLCQISRVGMHKGGLFTIHAPPAQTLIHAMPAGTDVSGVSYATSPYVVVSEPGQGRVVAIGDSSILSDGTDSHGRIDSSLESWNKSSEQNAGLLLNAVEWLAKENVHATE
jgi:hypothetical protein